MQTVLGINEIKKRLKHRYPFLLIDRVIELVEGESCTALKNITINEALFNGHFPQMPIFPGVLIVEALAQTAGIAGYSLHSDADKDLSYFAGFDNVRFKAPVIPGDQLILKAKFLKKKRNIWFMSGEAFVGDKLVTTAEFTLATVAPPKE
ncbi:MAG: 3-hydroxyacyl-[acyl-carrier-protein] dehydratase FabZ [Candidatus Lambdaproteobacteria bacterium RIFOXYD1_FULL_56_27]|uniref:3-hydroxyacyl-[acyl-carrier-protein] dehydratase FabZ n=1 Tax=Candidatus Lambdaproteobacteria bacterium RIFOXYD2_FULL_56_26 TaxID=1817773 RepID=A0A1F6GVN8_9PROT|nr:MAG: 3-hydroxyacyl-[acyl-carrier-protein] dehydratase FabZ [Candidatus Lambdaproteobacteria bacterium RIFOXYD2_FULL_56_26]OGH03750.1 MAG: 3-hydroxyacyl-[acyl-carrier-protein] dehydratase FabZ [Candidatus Lambdaproteobacteria bacterium RIFOXYC1_FULL_56_13]OGH07334.1 MAG: 3-hydroxyacyl-[acyl-carrier-protein] dehydratase FabZ [Candidatus Lambdaproteobacteria bacterium RIFOXYD1_FULL_56_27]